MLSLDRSTLRDLRDLSNSLDVAPEIVEYTDEVTIKIGGRKLAQLPRLVLGFGDDLRLGSLPLLAEVVHFGLAIEIEPEEDGACIAVRLPEGAIRDKQSATSP